MPYTLAQLQQMGATPVNNVLGSDAPPPSGSSNSQQTGFTLAQLQQMGATPVDETAAPQGNWLERTAAGTGKVLGGIGRGLIASEEGFAHSIGKAFGAESGAVNQGSQDITQSALKLRKLAQQTTDPIKKANYLRMADQQQQTADQMLQSHVASLPSNKQVLGQAAGVALDIASAGTYGKAAQGAKSFKMLSALPTAIQPLTKQAAIEGLKRSASRGFWQGFKEAGIQSAKFGGLWGSTQGAARALQADADAGEVASAALKGGLIGATTAGIIGGTIGGFQARSAQRAAQAELIKSGQADARQVGLTVDANGRLVADKQAQEVLNRKVDPMDVKLMKDANPDELKQMQEMYKIRQKASVDPLASSRPGGQAKSVVGREVQNQVDYVSKVRDETGKQIGEAARAMGPAPQDISSVVYGATDDAGQHTAGFFDDLTEAGVKVDPNTHQLVFQGSEFAKQPQAQKILQGVANDLLPDETGAITRTPIDILREKRALGYLLGELKKKNLLATNTQRILGRLAENLDAPLAQASPAYAELADKYSLASKTLRNIYSLAGKEFADAPEKIADLRFGEVANRIYGNASAKPSLVFGELEDAARSLGYDGKVDVARLARFNEFLDNLYGPTQTTSLRGDVGKAVNDAQEALVDTLPGGKTVKAAGRIGYNLFKGNPSELQKQAVEKYLFRTPTNFTGGGAAGAAGGEAGPTATLTSFQSGPGNSATSPEAQPSSTPPPQLKTNQAQLATNSVDIGRRNLETYVPKWSNQATNEMMVKLPSQGVVYFNPADMQFKPIPGGFRMKTLNGWITISKQDHGALFSELSKLFK